MVEIREIISGNKEYTTKEGVKKPALYYNIKITCDEVVIEKTESEKQRSITRSKEHHSVRSALDEIAGLVSGDNDAKPSLRPFYNDVIFDDGTEKYVKQNVLFDIIDSMWNLIMISEYIQPNLQGLVTCNVPPVNSPIGGFMGIPGFATPENNTQSRLNSEGSWDCQCGTKGLTSRFCYNCGSPRPAEEKSNSETVTKAEPQKWICPMCGTETGGKFCSNCGTPKPADDVFERSSDGN